MTGIHSGKDGPFGQDFSMIMQESSGSDCPMGMSFSGKGVNPSYTQGAEKQVREWSSAHTLPFPDIAEDQRRKITDTLDYPPEGSPGKDAG